MPDPTLTGLTVVGFYVLVVLLGVAADMVVRRNRRIERLERALEASERRHVRMRPKPAPLPEWAARRPPVPIEIPTPEPRPAINELRDFVRHAGSEWRNGPTNEASFPAHDSLVTLVAAGYDQFTQNRDTRQMVAISD